MMAEYKVALGNAYREGDEIKGASTVRNTAMTWGDLVAMLRKHDVRADKVGGFFAGAHFRGGQTGNANVLCRSLLTIDIDKLAGVSLNDVEFTLGLWIAGAYVAYTTHSHQPDSPRIRVVLPLSREVSAAEYGVMAKRFCEGMGFEMSAFDPASWSASRIMYTPAVPSGDLAWSVAVEGAAVDVDQYLPKMELVAADDFDLEVAYEAQPLDIDESKIAVYLDAYAAQDDYHAWVDVGQALKHQLGDAGLDVWREWSKRSEKYDERVLLSKWGSFGKREKGKLTFATIIHRVKEAGGVMAGDGEMAERLLEEAGQVGSLREYAAFKNRIAEMPLAVVDVELRNMLAGTLVKACGKVIGLTRGQIKKALLPQKSEATDGAAAPEWLAGWAYVEKRCEFAAIGQDYHIKREAFNAKFDHKAECRGEEYSVPASVFALQNALIPTVYDLMYWPGADDMYQFNGKTMLNSYIPHYVPHFDQYTEEQVAAIDTFLRHVDFTLVDEHERVILLDWMCYVVQNPGKRVNWTMLLQGAQGTGKTYFSKVMQEAIGENLRNVDPTIIAGRFSDWAHGSQVIVVEEIRINGTNKYEVLDKMKQYISNDTISIEEKGQTSRQVPNFSSYMLLTNYKDALPIQQGDRRYCVLFSRIQSEQQLYAELGGKDGAAAYFDRLFAALDNHGGAIAHWLMNREISKDFTPLGRAPETSSKVTMMSISASPEKDAIEGMIDEHYCAIINKDLIDITYLNQVVGVMGEGGQMLPKTRALSAILSEIGYEPIKGRRVKVAGKYHYIWRKCGSAFDDERVKGIVRNFYDKDEAPF